MTPPRISTWVLTHFNCAQDTESLLGDLSEELSRGRSHWWYRRQVLVAIVASAWTTMGAHKLLTTGAIVEGWVTFYAVQIIVNALSRMFLHDVPSGSWWLSTQHVFAWCGWPAAGWAVRKFHRRYGRAMLLAYAGSVCAFVTLLYCFLLLSFFLNNANIGAHALQLARFPLNALFVVASILLGGYWVRHSTAAIDTPTSAE